MITSFVCIFLAFGLYLFLLRSKRKLKKFPPGPTGLPIIGNVHQFDADVYKSFAKLKEKYGDIIGVQLGNYRAVVLHNPNHIREAFNINAFNGRPPYPHMVEPETKLQRGIIFTEGPVWSEQRRFALRNLRDFGFKFGSKSMESLIHDEVQIIIDELIRTAGKPVNTEKMFNIAVVNALWTIISGERNDQNDPKMKIMINKLKENTRNSKMQGALVFFPWFGKYFPNLSGLNSFVNKMTPTYDMVKKDIAHHKETYQADTKRDLIDCYIEEMKKPQAKDSSFAGIDGDAHLISTIFELFIAGTETTSTALSWVCLLLSHFPEVQEKVYREIIKVAGTERLPSLSDRQRMPFTEAMIMEVLRYVSLAPILVIHSAMETVIFEGYEIPKDTLIIANQWFVNQDPKNWGDPQNFRPERFLSSDGKSVIRHEAFMAFSTGKRACLGEALARDELFLFSTAIFQRFEVGFLPGKPIPELKCFPGAALSMPLPHELLMKHRNGL